MNTRIAFLVYRTTVIVMAGATVAGAWLMPRSVNYVDLLVALIGAAGVVVTVFGIWVAVIFPRFVASLGEGLPLGKAEDARRYKVLVKSLYRAALVLVSSLFVFIVLTFFGGDSSPLRTALCGFCLLAFLSLGESLFASIVSGELAASDAINEGVIIGVVRRRRRSAKREKTS